MDASRVRRWLAVAAGVVLSVVLVSSPWWGRPLLARLDFFRVRKIEVAGLQYLDAADVLSRLHVDTTKSIWMDLAPLESLVALHPQVQSVEVRRRLPGTLVVEIQENLPVALVSQSTGLRAVDVRGTLLPIDPATTAVDLPIVASRDTLVLQLLAGVRERSPALFGRVSDVRRSGDELQIRVANVLVRAMSGVTPARLADVVPVEQDLTARARRPSELDLRFRDQVVARFE